MQLSKSQNVDHNILLTLWSLFHLQTLQASTIKGIHQSMTDWEAGESNKMEFEGAIYKRTPYFCPILLIITSFYMAYLKFAEVYRATEWWKVNRLETGHICFVLSGTSFLLTFPSWYRGTFSPVSVFKHTVCSIFHTSLTRLSRTINHFCLDEFLLMDKMIDCIPQRFPQAHTQYGTWIRGWGVVVCCHLGMINHVGLNNKYREDGEWGGWWENIQVCKIKWMMQIIAWSITGWEYTDYPLMCQSSLLIDGNL